MINPEKNVKYIFSNTGYHPTTNDNFNNRIPVIFGTNITEY